MYEWATATTEHVKALQGAAVGKARGVCIMSHGRA